MLCADRCQHGGLRLSRRHERAPYALVHTPAGTPIEVSVATGDGDATLAVRDRGPWARFEIVLPLRRLPCSR